MADPHRVLRRRRGPLQLALGGVLVALVLVVEVLIVQAYVNVNRSTAIFGQVTFLTGNLVNVQREALLPTTSMPPRSAGPCSATSSTCWRGSAAATMPWPPPSRASMRTSRPGAGRTSSPTRHPCRSTSNLSGRQLEEQQLVGEVVQALETAKLAPRLLTLEITESVLVSDIEAMSARLRELKGLGVHLAIDDFGTGYSSLSYLRRFPIDMLKIDKAFGDGIGRGREETALAHAIIKLSHTLQLHAAAMTELLGRTLADGGFHLPVGKVAPVESLSG